MTPTDNKSKANKYLPSEQVKTLLKEKGFSKIFNYTDYNHYKKLVNDHFNKVQAIADFFILENQPNNKSDFNDYIF